MFWIHVNLTKGAVLDGAGFPVQLQNKPTTKLTVWTSKSAVLDFCKKHFKDDPLRDLGNKIEIDLPADHLPARTLAFVEITPV